MTYDKNVKVKRSCRDGNRHSIPSTSRRSSFRWAAADIVAMVVFSTIVGMSIELGVAGLSISETLRARAIAIPMNLGTGRPYGVFRDRMLSVIGSGQRPRFRKIVADTLSFILFQIPLYATVLLVSGASIAQAAIACLTMSGSFAVSGRPFGLFLDATRRLFRVNGTTEHDRFDSKDTGQMSDPE